MADRAAREGGSPEAARARPDLAATLVPLVRALIAAEKPILQAHQLSMWGYAVLLHLDEQPVRSQSALADAIGADKTRLIAVLDDLQTRGLIRRQSDPVDRRVRLLSITAEGQRVRKAVQSAIQHHEEKLLAFLTPAQRQGFLSALQSLAALPPNAITG